MPNNFLSPAYRFLGAKPIGTYNGPSGMSLARPIGTYDGSPIQYQPMSQRAPVPPLPPMQYGVPSSQAYGPPDGAARYAPGYGPPSQNLLGQASQAIAKAHAGQFTAPYENDPAISGMANMQAKNIYDRRNFFHAYNNQMGQAMQNQTPGMGLMGNEAAAQMGNYQRMPNVTVGGAYGQSPANGVSGFLDARLRDTKDPGELAALRARQPAPWMNTPSATPNNFDTTGTAASTLAARTARVAASGGALTMLPDGRITRGLGGGAGPTWPVVAGDGTTMPSGIGGGGGQGAGGSSIWSRRAIAHGPDERAARAQQTLARRDYYDQRRQAQGPNIMQQLLADGDPQTALALMQMQQQGELGRGELAAKNQANILADKRMGNENAVAMKGLEAQIEGIKNQGVALANQQAQFVAQNGIRSKELDAQMAQNKQQFDAAQAQGDRQHKEKMGALDGETSQKKLELAQEYDASAVAARAAGDEYTAQRHEAQARQLRGEQGNVMSGMPGVPGGRSLSMQQEEKLATYKTRQDKIRYLKSLTPKLTDAQINARLAEGHERGVVGDILGRAGVDYAPPSTSGEGGYSLRPGSYGTWVAGPMGWAYNAAAGAGWLTGKANAPPLASPTFSVDANGNRIPAEGWEFDENGKPRKKSQNFMQPDSSLNSAGWGSMGSY